MGDDAVSAPPGGWLDLIARAVGPRSSAASSGCPLIVDAETIGVLLAADRRGRRFADREIELLAALAAHAAVANHIADSVLFRKFRN